MSAGNECALQGATDFSLIVPCYNEAENLRVFIPTAIARLESIDASCELVFVDDGSTDGTARVIREQIAAYEKRVPAAAREDAGADVALVARREDADEGVSSDGGAPAPVSPGVSASASAGASDSIAAGSPDPAAPAACEPLARRRIAFRVVEFSRNFGKEAAMFAGLEQATGAALGFIDADMQQDPDVALDMYRLLREDPAIDCVAAVQEHRRESLPLRAFKRVFYRMFRDMSNLEIVEGASDFRVFTRQVADALLSMREHFRFSKGMFSWVGFKTRVITYRVHDRYAGKSKWSMGSLFSYAWNGVVAFSTWPLRAVMILGVVLALAALALFAVDAFDTVAFHDGVSMNRVLVYVVLLMSGIQMAVLGLFGEYLARAYIESKHRPLYVVRRAYEVPAR